MVLSIATSLINSQAKKSNRRHEHMYRNMFLGKEEVFQ